VGEQRRQRRRLGLRPILDPGRVDPVRVPGGRGEQAPAQNRDHPSSLLGGQARQLLQGELATAPRLPVDPLQGVGATVAGQGGGQQQRLLASG
jgi:hypothetical protein